jgi:hypothetical protein
MSRSKKLHVCASVPRRAPAKQSKAGFESKSRLPVAPLLLTERASMLALSAAATSLASNRTNLNN